MTIHFPDVSNHQAGMSLTGAIACIAKASEGTGFRDPYYAGFKEQARQLGIPFCGYHWINETDINGQAQLAYSMVGSGTPIMWDCEDDGCSVERILAITDAYRALGGVATLVYLPKWWWSGHLGSPDLTPLTAAGLSLIASNYTTYSDSGPGWNPYGGVYPAIWQYTSSYPFNGYNIDFNAYKGSIVDLEALFNGGSEHDVSSDATWQFMETGHRTNQPDTFTPEGYPTMPNNWMGEILGKSAADAKRAADNAEYLNTRLDALQARVDSFGDQFAEVISRLKRLEPNNP